MIGRGQRITDDNHSHAFAHQHAEELDALLLRNKVRRNDDEFGLGYCDHLLQVNAGNAVRPGQQLSDLFRIVEDHICLCRHQGQAAVRKPGCQFIIDALQELAIFALLQVFLALLGRVFERTVRHHRVEGVDGYRLWRIPVFVETIRNVLDDRADGKQVLVDKLGFAARLKVLVGEIASANDRHLVVNGKRFVVHAAIQNVEVRDEADEARAPTRKRIENAYLDVLVHVER